MRLYFSQRRLMEALSPQWQDEEDVLDRARLDQRSIKTSPHPRHMLGVLVDEGLVERDRYRVRMTDAGIIAAASATPVDGSLLDRPLTP